MRDQRLTAAGHLVTLFVADHHLRAHPWPACRRQTPHVAFAVENVVLLPERDCGSEILARSVDLSEDRAKALQQRAELGWIHRRGTVEHGDQRREIGPACGRQLEQAVEEGRHREGVGDALRLYDPTPSLQIGDVQRVVGPARHERAGERGDAGM